MLTVLCKIRQNIVLLSKVDTQEQEDMSNKMTVFIIITIAIVGLALYFGSPASEAWPLKCPLYQYTGWQCPLCGMQRGIHSLFHGDVISAWHYNPGLWIATPYFAMLFLGSVFPGVRENRIGKWCHRNEVIISALALFILWGIIRNL